MDRASATSVARPPAEAGLPLTWPHCAQVALAVLLALGIGFLLGRSFAGTGTRHEPTALDDDADEGPRLNLNRATERELALVPGLGPSRARAIVAHRTLHGPFRTVDELRQVHGVGPKTLDKIRPWLFADRAVDPAPVPLSPGEVSARPPTPIKSNKAAKLTAPINVNNGTLADLQKLPGIGPKLAQRILDERTLRGPFKTIEELRRVPGIGAKTLERLRPHIVIDTPPSVRVE